MYQYRATIVRVIDGDTVDVDIDLGFDVTLKNQRVRLIGIDSSEVRTRDAAEKERGLAAKAFVETLIPVGTEHLLISREYHGERGKFGRIIGDFEISNGTLTQAILDAGHAVPVTYRS